MLTLGTAAMSDGDGDMNWTLHVVCATGFFIITLIQIQIVSKIYKKFWKIDKNFVTPISYFIKVIFYN